MEFLAGFMRPKRSTVAPTSPVATSKYLQLYGRRDNFLRLLKHTIKQNNPPVPLYPRGRQRFSEDFAGYLRKCVLLVGNLKGAKKIGYGRFV